MIIEETCPICGHRLLSIEICTYPPIPRKECHNCGWSWEGEMEKIVQIPFRPPKPETAVAITVKEEKDMGRTSGVCTNDDCRKRFKELGLTYGDITTGDILTLVILLNQEIKKANESGETSVDTMCLSEKMTINTNEDGSIKECYLFMNSHYFKNRECISFNKDGFIGIAGWADEGNSNPIRRAFLEWCNILAKQKETLCQK